jgi:hypothetical protein
LQAKIREERAAIKRAREEAAKKAKAKADQVRPLAAPLSWDSRKLATDCQT